MIYLDNSATTYPKPPQVRQAVARGEDVSGLVPQAVAAYIGEHGLYRG